MWSQREGSDEAPLLVCAESAVCVLTFWLLDLLGLDSTSVVLHWSPVNPKRYT